MTPTFSSELKGNGDTIFNPGEVSLYTATGTALDLTHAGLPPQQECDQPDDLFANVFAGQVLAQRLSVDF